MIARTLCLNNLLSLSMTFSCMIECSDELVEWVSDSGYDACCAQMLYVLW